MYVPSLGLAYLTPSPEQSSDTAKDGYRWFFNFSTMLGPAPDLETLLDKHPRRLLKKCPAPSGWSECKAVGSAEPAAALRRRRRRQDGLGTTRALGFGSIS